MGALSLWLLNPNKNEERMRQLNIYAAEFIPIRMIISIAIVGAIAALVAVGYMNFSMTNAEHQVESEWLSLQSELYSMLGSGVARDLESSEGTEGTKRVHTFYLPDNLIYLAFGVDPDPHNTGVLETGLTEGGTVVCYQISGCSKHVEWLDDQFCFREGFLEGEEWKLGEQGFIIDSGGVSTIAFELVEKSGEEYLLIQATDSYTI